MDDDEWAALALLAHQMLGRVSAIGQALTGLESPALDEHARFRIRAIASDELARFTDILSGLAVAVPPGVLLAAHSKRAVPAAAG